MSEAARQEAASQLEFDANKLLATVRQALLTNDVLSADEDPSRDRIEVTVTSIRVRSTFSAVMWGFMAGDDHINGNVVVRSPSGNTAQTFSISASYALGGIIGGLDETRMGWLYQTFAKHVVQELTGKSEVVEVDPVEPTSGDPVPTVSNVAPSTSPVYSKSPSGIRALFSRVRLARDQGNEKFIEEFASDGTVKGERIASSSTAAASVAKDQGTWSTDNEGRLCVGWSKWDGGETRCLAVSSSGNTIRLLSPSGSVVRKYVVLSEPSNRVSASSLEKSSNHGTGEVENENGVIQTGLLKGKEINNFIRDRKFKSADQYPFAESHRTRHCWIIVTFKADGEIDGGCHTSFQTVESLYRSGRWVVASDGSLCLEGAFFGANKKCYRFTKNSNDFVLLGIKDTTEKYEFRSY